MNRFLLILIGLVALGLAAGAVFLYFWTIPAPAEPVQVELDVDRLVQ